MSISIAPDMSSASSVTVWLEQLRDGDSHAAQRLWERYWTRLIGVAHARLAGRRRGPADAEDAAQEAFEAFFRAARAGRYPQLEDRDDLWRLLVRITENKARDLIKGEKRAKRGDGQVISMHVPAAGSSLADPLNRHPDPAPTPEFAVEAMEEFRRLLALLGDEELQRIALLKMEGYTREEIAREFGCVPDTIGRRLRLIRAVWTEEGEP
jgi:RNA polymerase sigma factor (sigma-70 family)